MGLGQGRVGFSICITLLFMALVVLPFEKPTSPQFVILVLVIIMNAAILVGMIIKIRIEARKAMREREQWLKEMEERQLRP